MNRNLTTVPCAIIEKDGKILIARRAADQKLAGKWEFPGGKVEEGESPEECLKRELEEEFGIQDEVGVLGGGPQISNIEKYLFGRVLTPSICSCAKIKH